MNQPSGKTRYVVDVENTQAVRAWQTLSKAAKEYGLEIKKVSDEVDRTGKAKQDFTSKSMTGLKAMGTQLAAVAASWLSIREAINLATREWEFWEQKRQRALDTGLDVTAARGLALRMQHPQLGMDTAAIDAMVRGTRYQTGLTMGEGYRVAEALLSAAGGQFETKEDIQKAFTYGGRIATFSGTGMEGAREMAPAILDVMKATGVRSPEEALGIAYKSTATSRIQSFGAAMQTMPEAFTVGRTLGFSPAMVSALMNVLTSEGLDPTGQESITALTAIFRNIKEGMGRERYERPLRPDESGYWIRDSAGVRPSGKTVTETRPLPLVVDAEGRADWAADAPLRGLDAALAGGLPGQGFYWPGADLYPAADAQRMLRTRYRDPMGLLRYVQSNIRKLPEEGLSEEMKRLLSRGKFRGVVPGMLGGDPRLTRLIDQHYRMMQGAIEGGGAKEFFFEWQREMEASGAEQLVQSRYGAIGGEELAYENVTGRSQQLHLNILRDVFEAQPGKTFLGYKYDEFMGQLEFLGGAAPRDVILRRLRAEREKVRPRWETELTGYGGPRAYDSFKPPPTRRVRRGDPKVYGTLDTLIEQLEATPDPTVQSPGPPPRGPAPGGRMRNPGYMIGPGGMPMYVPLAEMSLGLLGLNDEGFQDFGRELTRDAAWVAGRAAEELAGSGQILINNFAPLKTLRHTGIARRLSLARSLGRQRVIDRYGADEIWADGSGAAPASGFDAAAYSARLDELDLGAAADAGGYSYGRVMGEQLAGSAHRRSQVNSDFDAAISRAGGNFGAAIDAITALPRRLAGLFNRSALVDAGAVRSGPALRDVGNY